MTDTQSLIQAAATVSQKLLNSIVATRAQRLKQGLNPDKSPAPEPPHLAHYTTANGLLGIVHNGQLWASAAYYLNDSSEIDYGCQLFMRLLAKLIDDEGLDPVSRKIFEVAKKAFEPGGFMESVVYRTYVTCFCEDPNLLSQWRTYGQTGGYSIIFPRPSLQKGLTVHDELYRVELNRVIYDEQVQVQLLQLVLSDLLSALQEDSIREMYSAFGQEEKQVFIISFNSMLQTMAANEIVRFKHPAFEGEKEWRLIVRPNSPYLNAQEIQQLKFRTTRGMLVPYLEVKPKQGVLLPITSVRYGPTLERKRTVNSLHLLFQQKGYSGVGFDGSEIPVVLP